MGRWRCLIWYCCIWYWSLLNNMHILPFYTSCFYYVLYTIWIAWKPKTTMIIFSFFFFFFFFFFFLSLQRNKNWHSQVLIPVLTSIYFIGTRRNCRRYILPWTCWSECLSCINTVYHVTVKHRVWIGNWRGNSMWKDAVNFIDFFLIFSYRNFPYLFTWDIPGVGNLSGTECLI